MPEAVRPMVQSPSPVVQAIAPPLPAVAVPGQGPALGRVAMTTEPASVPLEPAGYDCIAIVTDHPGIDYPGLVDDGAVIVDFRNATGDAGRVYEVTPRARRHRVGTEEHELRRSAA